MHQGVGEEMNIYRDLLRTDNLPTLCYSLPQILPSLNSTTTHRQGITSLILQESIGGLQMLGNYLRLHSLQVAEPRFKLPML